MIPLDGLAILRRPGNIRASMSAAGEAKKRQSRIVIPRRGLGTTEGKRMKRRDFLKVGGVGLAASAVAAPADRAIDARGEMAAGRELAEVARYALRRLRIFLQARRRDHRQPIPDPAVRSGRNRAGPAGARRRVERHGRDGQYRALLLLGQEPGLHLRHVAAVRPQHAPAHLLAVVGRRPGHAQRSPEGAPLHRHSHREAPARRWAAGSARRSRRSRISRD